MSLTKATYSMISGAPVNVFDFGAVGNGITDDTAAIQAAINSFGIAGGTLILPVGTYKVTNTININKPIFMIGSTPGSTYQPTTTPAVSIVWGGSVGGNIIKFGGFGTLISGGGIEGILIDGSLTAATALYVKDSQRGYFRGLTITGVTAHGLLLENTGALSNPTGFMIFDDLRIQLRGGPTDNATGIFVNGDGTGAAGVTFCTFRRCRIDHANGAGVVVGNVGDFFFWESLQTFRADVETGQGVWFNGTSPTSVCGGHTFISPNISAGFRFDTANIQLQTRIINAGQVDINSASRPIFGAGAADVVMDTGLGFAYGQGLLNPIHTFSQRDNMALIRWDSANSVMHTAQGNWRTNLVGSGTITSANQAGSALRLRTGNTINDTTSFFDNETIGTGDGFLPEYSFAGDFIVAPIDISATIVRVGFSNSLGDSPSNGIYVEYDSSSSAFWKIICTQAGVSTVVTSSLAFFAGKIEIYIYVAEVGGGVSFYYRTNGNRLFGFFGTITTNIPVVALSTICRIKTLASTAKEIDVYAVKTAAIDEVFA